MAPVSCLIIVPWEFAITVQGLIRPTVFNYGMIAHLAWSLLEFSIIFVILFHIRYYSRQKTVFYLIFVLLNTILMSLIFLLPKGQIYTSYINTIIGVSVWLFYTARVNYPRTRLNAAIFILKLIADVLGFMAYYDYDAVVLIMSIVLPIIDTAHLWIFFRKKSQHKFSNFRLNRNRGDHRI